MLNDWIMTCAWGGVNNRLGNHSHILLKNFNDAKKYIDTMMIRREKRGYELQIAPG